MKLTHVPILSFPARYMVSPIRHYVLTGAAERRNPCPYFDTRAFLARNPEAIAENINPFYLHLKQKENRDRQKQSEKHDYELLRKSPLFDSEYYLQYNADIRRKGADPAWHFLKAGWREGRNPSAAFDVQYYLELNADLVQNGKVENPLLHYLKRGIREKRRIVPAVFPRVMPLEKILNAFRPGDITTLSAASPRVPGKILVVIHLFYEEMLPEFIEYLKNIPYEFDIAISLTEQSVLPADKTLKAALPNCRSVRLVHARNCGRDIGPFLVEFGTLAGEYDYICKIHTKKDLSGVGAGWRTLALRNMLGSEQLVRNILAEFETNASTGMVYPRPPLVALSAVAGRGAWGGNHEAACELGRRAGLDFSGVTEFDFPAGSMFWARSRALKKLLTLPVSYDDFSRIIGWDGSPAHAVERLFGVIPVMEGFSLKSVFVYPPVPEEPPRPYTPLDDDTLLNRIREYKARKRPGNRIAVYTAMAGGYDSIPTPEELDPEVDYICFSDSVLDGEHPWEMRPLDYFNADRTRITRYYKLHPHTYFSGYEHVIWMDSNIQIRRNVIRKLIDTYKAGGNPLATIRHPERNCTYIEAKICGGSRLDDAKVIEAQIQRYREAGLPERNGLPETNIYVTAPDDPRSITLFADWWKELENGSRRDQLSIMYVLYKNGFSYTPLFDNYEDGPRYSSTDFTYFMHKNHENLMFPSVYRYPPFICERKRSITDDLADRTAALPSGDPRLDIIIPVHNALADLKNCLESLMPTLGRSQNVILVNDGSDPETVSFLADFAAGRPEKIRLISHESALGYTVSINEAARLSSADYLVFLNSDTIVPPNWWRKLVRCAESSPDIGIVGPLSNAASWQTVPVLREGSGYCVNSLPEGISVEDADRICEKTARPGFYPKCQLINGFCFFVKRSVFDRIGLFDEKNFPTGYGEEDDLCLRAADAGFISAIAADTYVYHAKSKSFGHAARQELCRQNQLKFLKKHSRNRLERECRTLEEVPELVRMRMLTGDRLAAIPPGRNADAAAADLLKPGNRLGLVPRCGRGEGCYYASSHVRLLDWMDAYTEEGRSVEILKSGSLNKCDFSAYDALVVCRDAVPPEQTGLFLEKCNSAGIPFYMELDDHLFLVPEMEPAWPSLERMVRSAAGVIVSVPALADTFRKLNPNILLKPNCLNRKLWLDSPIPKLDRNSAETISRNRRGVNVIYYGSFTHGQDLAIISKIIPLLKERFDVQFFLVGGCKATELKDSAWIPLCPPVTKYNEFIPWFRAVAETMDIGLAPLDPYKGLNAYKSPLKFLEGGICRLCMICSTLVYDSVVKDGENGLLAEYSGEAWMQALTTAIEDCSLRKRLAERAFTEICETRIIGQDKFQEVFQGKKAEE
ncbi:MAG: glycosyltransferase [Lentisphaeria bacterium]|nr:glycosyltransferase [Lentisphaeria bacterium]